ncbi:PIN domain-containing protein [Candidatus Woesearchaeota archaeon]|nr:PIN domain-containing protein [Candidatus Woesearchaeota archaeon]
MRFIDSNVLAYAFYENEFQDSCQKVIHDGGIINTLNLVEAFNVIELSTSREIAIRSIKSILKSNLQIVDIDINLVFEALKRAPNKNLKFIDLIHYTVAALNNCESIISYDKDFDRTDIKRKKE